MSKPQAYKIKESGDNVRVESRDGSFKATYPKDLWHELRVQHDQTNQELAKEMHDYLFDV